MLLDLLIDRPVYKLVLWYMGQGLTYKEIAEASDYSTKSIQIYVCQMKKILREKAKRNLNTYQLYIAANQYFLAAEKESEIESEVKK